MHQRRQNEGIHEAVEVVEKLLQRELGHRQELSREGRLCAIHQLGGRNAIGLRVVGSCHHVLDAQGATEGRPRRGSELGSSVRGYSGRDPETGDPLNEGVDASCCGSILDGVGGALNRPPWFSGSPDSSKPRHRWLCSCHATKTWTLADGGSPRYQGEKGREVH